MQHIAHSRCPIRAKAAHSSSHSSHNSLSSSLSVDSEAAGVASPRALFACFFPLGTHSGLATCSDRHGARRTLPGSLRERVTLGQQGHRESGPRVQTAHTQLVFLSPCDMAYRGNTVRSGITKVVVATYIVYIRTVSYIPMTDTTLTNSHGRCTCPNSGSKVIR